MSLLEFLRSTLNGGRNRFLFFWIIAGTVVTAFAVYKALESPDRP